jgi:hypothetical protein
LTFALHNPAPDAPFAHIDHQQHNALVRLATIFEEIADPEGPSLELNPVPATTPIIMPFLVPATSPSAKQNLAPSPRVAAPVPRVEASLPRVVHVPVSTPNAHRRLNPTTPMSSKKFDLYKQRRHTMTSASRHQSPSSEPQVANRVVDYLNPTTRNLMDDVQAETHRYYNTRSHTLLIEARHVDTFVPDADTNIKKKYGMNMANEVTHPVTD